MRYFCFNDPDINEEGKLIDNITTVSERWIRDNYYPYWQEQMYKKFGKDYVDKNYCFEDCLDQWIVVNWAWES